MAFAGVQALQALRQAIQDASVAKEAKSGALSKIRSAGGGRLDTMESIMQEIRMHMK